ncbi:YqhR family membrane protein [Geomicrobium sp. JSM 1781026]|uniref:YqhR family membrane protein n=1 Tax=Geomicrobium sp. JSM 1781026 TaxID=3344580 RepID=UPI0035C2021F
MSDEKNESKKANQDLPLGLKVLITGFVGGLFWGIIWYVAYFFNFTDVGPNLLWKAWTLGSWSEEATGQWIAISLLAILSIGVAFFYRYVFAKITSMWAGVGFGALLWVIIFYISNPLFIGLDSVPDLSGITIVSTLSLFVCYGLFIGYSISYEYEMEKYTGT